MSSTNLPLVDPVHFTDYNRDEPALQAAALFTVLVAGKQALPTANSLHKLLRSSQRQLNTKARYPFRLLEPFSISQLREEIRSVGIGCYNHKAISVHELVHSDLDLRKCTVEDLEAIYGIGPKTARFFLLHTRPNQQIAVLDTHILRHLRDLGHMSVPTSTPGSSKRYREIEQLALRAARRVGMSPADWDLHVWNVYRRGGRNGQTNSAR